MIICFAFSLLVGCKTTQTDQAYTQKEKVGTEENERKYVFGWGPVDIGLAVTRGGTSRGSLVKLSEPTPLKISEKSSSIEMDRAAILSMAGSYKVDFHFMEALGLTPDFKPQNRYNSWGTEFVHVLEDSQDFISLQHTLVMYFEDEDGVSEPMVMKHWRQDWKYQDDTIFAFQGDLTWGKKVYKAEEVEGTWTQAVFQVDDSPRYEVIGKWEHHGNLSRWISQTDARPLPRREYSQRSDYKILEGVHQIIITPTGWVHEQINWKRVSSKSSASQPTYLSQEIGINRYERIDEPDVAGPTKEYFNMSGDYWASVRQVWRELMDTKDTLSLHQKVNGLSQFMVHFQNAETPGNAEERARDAVESFLK